MSKFYRVKKDTFMWREGAIIKSDDDSHHRPIEDIWNAVDLRTEYISGHIIENQPEWFERVYPDTLTGNIFRTAEQLREIYKEAFKAS